MRQVYRLASTLAQGRVYREHFYLDTCTCIRRPPREPQRDKELPLSPDIRPKQAPRAPPMSAMRTASAVFARPTATPSPERVPQFSATSATSRLIVEQSCPVTCKLR